MNWNDIRAKAVALGISPGRKKKAELIREIQTAEGNTPCFGTREEGCPYTDCCWLEDCFDHHRKTAR